MAAASGNFQALWRSLAMSVVGVLSFGASAARADTIYWSEYTSGFGAVYSLDVSSGKVSTLINGTGSGAGGNDIDYPDALAIGPDGNIYVGNANNGRIVKVTPNGVVAPLWGGFMPIVTD